jgi:hypothetical protein
MRYFDLLEKSSKPTKIIKMLHGTGTHSAGEIMQHGFVANPEWKSYNDYDSLFLESLEGTYFSDSLEMAVKYAHKVAMEGADSLAIVEAEIDLHKAVPDEDLILAAIHHALQTSQNAESFAYNFHHNLAGNQNIQMQLPLLKKLKGAYEKAVDEDEEDVAKYRKILNKVCHAYAAMVLEPHPVYMGGAHSIRLPKGLPAKNIVAVTSFWIGEDWTVTDVTAMKGTAIDEMALQDAVNELVAQGLLG